MKRDWQKTRQQIAEGSNPLRDISSVLSMHRVKVLAALMRGENVPSKVLADYPGLIDKAAHANAKLEENRLIFGAAAPWAEQVTA